jgi:hypothetical protein
LELFNGARMNSVSLIVSGAHERYAQYAQRWWDALLAMEKRPDEIVATIDENDSAGLAAIIDPNEVSAQIIVMPEPYSVNYINTAIAAAQGEWLSFCGIDDMMRPRAYADIHEAGDADIIIGTLDLSTGITWGGMWNPEFLMSHNTLPAHSFIRKQLWEELEGLPDIRWSDWGFWLKCAKRGVKTYPSKNVTAWHDLGLNHETISGLSLPAEVRTAADEELHQFRRELFGE